MRIYVNENYWQGMASNGDVYAIRAIDSHDETIFRFNYVPQHRVIKLTFDELLALVFPEDFPEAPSDH